MALQSKERYEPQKIERLNQHLRLYFDKGQPIDYEIIVDGFKVVRRTNDPEMFSLYESFVDADTKSMEVLLYSGSSNNNDKRIFYFGDKPKDELSGIDLKDQIKAEVRQENRLDELEEENRELKAEIEDLEKEVEKLEKANADLEANQSPLKGVLGEIGSSFVESFIRRNPQVLKGIPGGEALAGLIGNDNKIKDQQESSQEETQVSFKSRNSGEDASSSETLTEADKSAITFVNQLKAQFTKDEFDNVLIILQTLADDKSKIALTLNHVKH